MGSHGSKGLVTRMRSILRIAADRIRQGLSPQSLTAPAITGTAPVGAVLQATPGTWDDATSSGVTLRVVVTAANAVGQMSVASAPTAPVP
jgi:hypothetical protein